MTDQPKNADFHDSSFLQGHNAAYIEQLYGQWAQNPGAFDAAWDAFFRSLGDAGEDAAREAEGASWKRADWPPMPSDETTAALTGEWPMASKDEARAAMKKIAAKAGIAAGNIVLDPGIGFGKTPQQSMTALARLDQLARFGLPLLVGASRKRFISTVVPSEPQQRIGGSLAAHLIAARNGARIIRAHDVAETVQALRVAAAIEGKQ